MVSKRERKRYAHYLAERARFMDLELTHLFIQEIRLERRMRNKGLRLAKKRKKQSDSWVV